MINFNNNVYNTYSISSVKKNKYKKEKDKCLVRLLLKMMILVDLKVCLIVIGANQRCNNKRNFCRVTK